MTKTNTIKRLAAGMLAMALVAGAAPANVGGFLTQGTAIVASAGAPGSSTSGTEIPGGNITIYDTTYSPIWNWIKTDTGYDVYVQFKYLDTGEIIEGTYQQVEPSVNDNNGVRTFTATVTYNNQDYTSVKDETITYNITIDGVQRTYNYGEQIMAVAPAMSDGQYFDGWYEDINDGWNVVNTKISGTPTYYFYATEDKTIESKYKPSPVDTQPVTSIKVSNRQELASGKEKVSITYDWELPDGCTLVEAGIIRCFDENFIDTTTHKSKLTTSRGTYKLNLTLGSQSKKYYIYVKGYVKYMDANNTEQIMYTDNGLSRPKIIIK